MIISDKQELRRCVKQLVRRANVCEASLDFDVEHGEVGVEAMLDLWARPAVTPGEALLRSTADQTPFSPDARAMFAALDALDLPVKDLDRAKTLQLEYERPAYLREVLDTLRAKCVLVRVKAGHASAAVFEDDRFEPLLVAESERFAPGRYGVDYAGAARMLADAAAVCGARNIAPERFDLEALKYCLLPLCQDGGYALHVHLSSEEEIARFALLLDEFDGVRALVSADHSAQKRLIDEAAQRVRMLVCLDGTDELAYALERLGTRFVAFSAGARLPEQMLGRWLLEKEKIWQVMSEAYLPLARTGYELESSAIERDVRRILCDNLLSLCRSEQT
ncbi:MAG: hypothetical protein E7321_03265 [Clostridiales bacterium]|nr:hypothetical protein [Clostridiales bacterium]